MAQTAPRPKEQSKLTDPDSRIMKTARCWIQGYNAQILVEESSGVGVAQEVTYHGGDNLRLGPMLHWSIRTSLARLEVPEGELRPWWSTADAGYRGERNLRVLAEAQIDAYAAADRERHHRAGISRRVRTRTPLRAGMRVKLLTPGGKAIYARRKAIT